MSSTILSSISEAGWAVVTDQLAFSSDRNSGVKETSGSCASLAIEASAIAPGTPPVPTSTSTLSSSISLRAFRADCDGSEASSSWMNSRV